MGEHEWRRDPAATLVRDRRPPVGVARFVSTPLPGRVVPGGIVGATTGTARALRPGDLLALQRAAGNAAVRSRLAALHGEAFVQRARRRRPVTIPAGAVRSSRLGKLGSDEETAFRRLVYDAQLEMSARDPTKHFLAGLPEDQLEVVEGRNRMRKGTVAADARSLLAQARADLEAEKARARRGAAVRKVTNIGIDNAYRSLGDELGAWTRAYGTAFKATKPDRAELADGEFGPAAVRLMAERLFTFKAIPGYSRHTKGLAIDFTTTQDGKTLGPSGSDTAAWKKSWLYRWLKDHAAEFDFEPYTKEAWHWQHAAPADASEPGGESEAPEG